MPVTYTFIHPVKDFISSNTNMTKNYTTGMTSLVIVVDEDGSIEVDVNGMTLVVKSTDRVFDEVFEPFTTITIRASVAYRIYARTRKATT